MKSNTLLLQPDTFYHIYNRGINGETIFKADANYFHFLNKYAKYITKVADTYAYCLLKNHFHLLIRTKSAEEIKAVFLWKEEVPVSRIISTQFSHLFNGYSQAINKTFARTGSLFETPFRRKEITEDAYLRQLVFYIHFNPQRHGLCEDFKSYRYSSYCSLISDSSTKLNREEVIAWFGGKKEFLHFHTDLGNQGSFDVALNESLLV